ncbi:DsbC family protein [Asticcacaulis excentricus]|uniref:Thiol:disulfide interchange protein n=1 Tax=Asticcacaulis excentricus (strain ATCC 15261 / DSM 4724 / KCTC 12464 / NCIMB 9791 / VKM B-1370 / CB 48) TaxID=573065 RepID=E8RVX5_ASTEC|nr:DsbC family protein [Asticcacaulis excentricus]ADU15397.1 disulfide bond isomerase, DsbC/G-like protein [Asticcacaulis excentricus CB 48]
MLPLSKPKLIVPAMLALVAIAVTGTFLLGPKTEETVKTKIAAHFPNSTVNSVSCKTAIGLCEVVMGKNLLYATRDGRYVVVGAVLDLKARKDLTDQRLKELAAVDAATTSVEGQRVEAPVKAAAGKLSVTLPKANAVIHNPGAPLKMTVFGDYSCGYCHQLFAQLAGTTNIEITEYPIAILGPQSAEKARLVMCAGDRAAAAEAAYTGGEIKTGADCAKFDAVIAENTRFAQANGINGTPAIIRADGTVNAGFLPLPDLIRFLEGKNV